MANDLRETFTATGAEAITPNDSGSLSGIRALNVAADGLVFVDTEDGDSNVSVYIAAGIAFPIAVTRVYSTGTTATGIRGLK